MRSVRSEFLAALAIAAALFLLSRTRQGQLAVAGATDAVMSAITGIRLNNPLNIERGDPWDGLAPDQPDARFAKFVSMPYGIRAALRTFITYRNKYGINTVGALIDRWNPKSDGQPETYIPHVARDLGVAPGYEYKTTIDVTSRPVAFALLRSMMKMEIGSAAALLVSDADVQAGITLAGVR